MCGIFAEVSRKGSVNQHILDGLKKLEYRGYDSWGAAVIVDSAGQTIAVEKHVGRIQQEKLSLPQSTIGFGHTRWATHGGVSEKNSHPHLDCVKRIAVVHNGIIENYLELKAALKKEHKFVSETDTEVFAHLVEEEMESLSFFDAVRAAFAKVKGWNAVIVLDGVSKEIVAVRNGSPLVLGVGQDATYLVSDPHALLPYTKQIHYLEDNECVHITQQSVKLFDLEGRERKLQTTTLNLQERSADLGEYEHFMLKEIHEQLGIWQKISQTPVEMLERWKNTVREYERLIFLGCGTAYHASMIARMLAQKELDIPADAIIASEWKDSVVFDQKMFPIFLSQSGETVDILEVAREVKARNMKCAALINVEGSSLFRLCDVVAPLEAGPEICVLATKSFTAKIAKLLMLFAYAKNKEEYRVVKEEVEKAAKQLEEILKPSFVQTYFEPIADIISRHPRCFVLGRGLSYPIALETALKIKEGSYVHAEGFAAGELKHGVIALVEEGTPCVLFVPEGENKSSMLANAMEIKARGGYVIGVGATQEEVFDRWIPTPNYGKATILLEAVIGQLLGYYTALKLGRDIDKPRNLAKSVTVK